MDILRSYQFHRWLLWVAIAVLLLECQRVSGSSHPCPQGQLLHRWERNGRKYITCCYPTRCGVGEQVKACQTNGTKDTCEMCHPHYNQSQRTSSFTMDKCTSWPLDRECRNVHTPLDHMDTNDWRTKRCMCNIEMGLKFDPPESIYEGAPSDAYCQRMSAPCDPGYEPTESGKCKECKPNYFKQHQSFKLCEPKTNCAMLGLDFVHVSDATADNNCSKPEPITTPKPVITERPTSPVVIVEPTTTVASTTVSGDGVRSGSSRSSDRSDSDDTIMPWAVVVPVIFVFVVAGILVFILCHRKRKGKEMCGCLSTKNCTDPEKYIAPSSTTMHNHGDQRNKHHLVNGGVITPDLTGSDKVSNNNVSGSHHYNGGSSQPNGDATYNFSSADSSSLEDPSLYPNSQSPIHYSHQPTANVPTSRQGILRNGQNRRAGNVVYAQRQVSVPEQSLDSIVREKLQVNVDAMEANHEHGESDPLLVTELPRRGAACLQESQFQNLASSAGSSPPVLQAGINPMCFISSSGVQGNLTQLYVKSVGGMPSSPRQGPFNQVAYVPSSDAVTFTRSTSVIASPEGEVDEDELEARVPRFSQLLPDVEDASTSAVPPSNPIIRMLNERDHDLGRSNSSPRESTQQLRAPSQRLMRNQYQQPPLQQQQQQQHRQGNPPPQQHPQPQQRQGYPVRGPVRESQPQDSQPDHRIMDLKEQQLEDSPPQSSAPSSLDMQVKQVIDTPSEEDSSANTVTPSPTSEERQQTELKARLSPATMDGNLSSNSGASAHTKSAKSSTAPKGPSTTEDTKPGDGGGVRQTLSDRKRQRSGGSNSSSGPEKKRDLSEDNGVHTATDRKRMHSGGSNNSGSAQNTLERRRMPSGGEQQKSCLKTSSCCPSENDTAVKKHHYNRTVSFEEDETAVKQPGHASESRQHGTQLNAEKSGMDAKSRAVLRSVSDPEQTSSGQGESSDEETERKCASLDSSKTSGSGDQSGSDSRHSSPSRAALYRRSQSENAGVSSESPHKPPPRSMSEEKPQKMERPVAKVKPMPASDNTLNELSEAADRPAQQSTTTAAAANSSNNTSANSVFSYSSDESDSQTDSEPSHPATTALDDEGVVGEDEERRGRNRTVEQ